MSTQTTIERDPNALMTQVIITRFLRGNEITERLREVTQVRTLDGALIAEYDPQSPVERLARELEVARGGFRLQIEHSHDINRRLTEERDKALAGWAEAESALAEIAARCGELEAEVAHVRRASPGFIAPIGSTVNVSFCDRVERVPALEIGGPSLFSRVTVTSPIPPNFDGRPVAEVSEELPTSAKSAIITPEPSDDHVDLPATEPVTDAPASSIIWLGDPSQAAPKCEKCGRDKTKRGNQGYRCEPCIGKKIQETWERKRQESSAGKTSKPNVPASPSTSTPKSSRTASLKRAASKKAAVTTAAFPVKLEPKQAAPVGRPLTKEWKLTPVPTHPAPTVSVYALALESKFQVAIATGRQSGPCRVKGKMWFTKTEKGDGYHVYAEAPDYSLGTVVAVAKATDEDWVLKVPGLDGEVNLGKVG